MPIKGTVAQMSRFRRWLFLYATRIVEFINVLFTIGFSSAFIVDVLDGSGDMVELDSYIDFARVDTYMWTAFFLLGVCQLIAMLGQSIRSNKASALLLVISAAAWAFIAGTFVSSRAGLITTAPIVYGSWAFVTFMAGYELLSINKRIESVANEEA